MDEQTFNALPDKDKFNTLEGIAYYAHVHRPNYSAYKKFGSTPAFEVKLGLESDAEIKKAQDLGLKVLEPTDSIPIPHVELKKKVKDMDDPLASKPSVVDSMQNEIPEEILIGNGSKVLCKFARFWHANTKVHGLGKTLIKMQILNLVPFEASGDSDMVKNPDGFTVTSFKNNNNDTPVHPVTVDEVPFEEDELPQLES